MIKMKQLKDEPWPSDTKWKWRSVDQCGDGCYFTSKPKLGDVSETGADWTWDNGDNNGYKMIRDDYGAYERFDGYDYRDSLERNPAEFMPVEPKNLGMLSEIVPTIDGLYLFKDEMLMEVSEADVLAMAKHFGLVD